MLIPYCWRVVFHCYQVANKINKGQTVTSGFDLLNLSSKMSAWCCGLATEATELKPWPIGANHHCTAETMRQRHVRQIVTPTAGTG